MRDVVIVGAGHNALVAACYLAREGLDVEVVERDTIVGGAVSTVERFPGYQVDRGSSAHIMVRHTGIVEDLRLDECGLRYLDCDPWAFAPYNERRTVSRPSRSAPTWPRPATASPTSAATATPMPTRRFAIDWGARNAKIFEAFQHPPTMRHLGPTAVERRPVNGSQGPRARPPVPAAGRRAAGRDLHRRATQDRAVLAGRPVRTARLTRSRPPTWSAGTWSCTTSRPAARSAVPAPCPRRWPTRFRSYGGTLRLGDAAAAIDRSLAAGSTGVRTAGGDEIRAERVLAGCHVLTTLRAARGRRTCSRTPSGGSVSATASA